MIPESYEVEKELLNSICDKLGWSLIEPGEIPFWTVEISKNDKITGDYAIAMRLEAELVKMDWALELMNKHRNPAKWFELTAMTVGQYTELVKYNPTDPLSKAWAIIRCFYNMVHEKYVL
jgi:hypothetical protein